MALTLGGFTNLASGTGTRSWSSPSTANKAYGVVVISGGAVDETSGVTWGGQAMSREYTGANTSGESGTTSIWFIQAPGTGAQTVEITRSGSTAYIATAFDGTTTTGYASVETGNTMVSTSTSAVPLNVTIPSGTVVAIYGGLYSGENAVSSITDAADMTRRHSADFGNFVSVISQKTTTYTGTGAAYTGFNYTQSSDDAGAAVIAIKESPPAPKSITLPLITSTATAYAPGSITNRNVDMALPLVASGISWAEQVLALGPIAWWRLGETSGSDAYEEINGLYSGYGNTPTLGVSGLVGDDNKAVSFAAASNEYVYEAGTGLPAGSTAGASMFVAFSLASYPNNIQTFIRWGAQNTLSAFHWLFYDNRGVTPPGADDLVWQYSDGLGVSAEWAIWPDAGLSLDTTYRLAVVHDYAAETVKWYVNGVLQHTTDLSAQDPPVGAVIANKETYLASYTGTQYPLDGILDEPMIFDYALSQADVEALEAAAGGGGGATAFPPTIEAAAGTPTWDLPLIDAAAAIYAPTLTPKYALTLPLAESTPALYEPTITAGPLTMTVPLIDAAGTLYAPTLAPAPYPVTLPFLESSPDAFAPTLVHRFPVTLPLVESTPAIYAPELAHRATLTLPLADSTPAAYAPVLLPAQFITMPLAESAPDAYAPTIAAGGVTLTLPLVDAGADLYPPSIIGISALVLPLAGGDPAIYAPELSVVLAVPLIDAGNAAYAPELAPAPYPVTLPLVDAGSAIYAPTITGGSGGAQSLELPVVESLPAAYAPTLTAKYLLDLPLASSDPAIFAPVLVPVSSVTLPLVDSSPAAYAPTVAAGGYSIVLPAAESTPDAYAPVLVPAAVTLTLPLAGDDPAIYAPVIEGISTQLLSLPIVESSPGIFVPAITKASVVIAGVTRSANGSPLPSCTVLVYRSDTNEYVTSTTSDGNGAYTVTVPGGREYFLVAYSAAGVYGTTARDLEGV